MSKSFISSALKAAYSEPNNETKVSGPSALSAALAASAKEVTQGFSSRDAESKFGTTAVGTATILAASSITQALEAGFPPRELKIGFDAAAASGAAFTTKDCTITLNRYAARSFFFNTARGGASTATRVIQLVQDGFDVARSYCGRLCTWSQVTAISDALGVEVGLLGNPFQFTPVCIYNSY